MTLCQIIYVTNQGSTGSVGGGYEPDESMVRAGVEALFAWELAHHELDTGGEYSARELVTEILKAAIPLTSVRQPS